jgi:ABC-type uncharacterized transport system auxiliary subunit
MRSGAIVLLVVGLAGCTLFPVPPAAPRYFTPDAGDAPARDPERSVAVQLAPVRSPLHLRELMTWRRSEVEFGYYEQRRWAELPATYVERALALELGAVEREPAAGAPAAPLVTAELRAFEEVLAPVHEARVALAVTVIDGACVRLRQTFVASRPLATDDPTVIARAIGESLDEVMQNTGTAVRRALAHRGRCGI